MSEQLLLDAAQCIDDCLVRLARDQYSDSELYAAAKRFEAGGGTINRISTLADALRKESKGDGRPDKFVEDASCYYHFPCGHCANRGKTAEFCRGCRHYLK